MEKEVTTAGGGPTHVHYYYNHDWQLLEECSVDGEGELTASNQYVWSPRYIDAPIARFHDANGDGDLLDVGDNTRYYTDDANYNVTATIDAATVAVVDRYVYTPYGAATVYDDAWSNPAAPTTDGPLYCGYFFDAETALYQVRHRYYNSSLSTFISRDPIGFDGGFNLYEYVSSRPVIAADPHGLTLTVLPETITDMPLSQAINLAYLGTTDVSFKWVTARQTVSVDVMAVDRCICESEEIVVASWTIERVSTGFITS